MIVKPELIISDDQAGLVARLASALAFATPITGFIHLVGKPVLVTFIRFYYVKGTFYSLLVFNRTVFAAHHLLVDFMHLYGQLLDLPVFDGSNKAHRERTTTATGICLSKSPIVGCKKEILMRFDKCLPDFVRRPLRCPEHVAAVNQLLKSKNETEFNCVLHLVREDKCPPSLLKDMSAELIASLTKVAPVYAALPKDRKGLLICRRPDCSCHQTVAALRSRIKSNSAITHSDAFSLIMHAVPSSLSDSLRDYFSEAIRDLKPDVMYYPTGDLKVLAPSELAPSPLNLLAPSLLAPSLLAPNPLNLLAPSLLAAPPPKKKRLLPAERAKKKKSKQVENKENQDSSNV